MEPAIQNLHNQVIQTDAYKEVKTELDDLKGGQDAIMDEFRKHEAENKRQFDHGAEIMNSLKDQVKVNADKIDEVIKDVSGIKDIMTKHHSDTINAIHAKENERLKEYIRELKDDDKRSKDEMSKLKISSIILGGTSLLSLLVWLIQKAFNIG